jgi:hypothetical protein
MNRSRTEFERVFRTGRPDIPFAIPVALHPTVTAVDHDVVSEIKLSPFVEERVLDVFLKDIGLVGAIAMLLFCLQDSLDFTQLQTDNDSVSSVGVLTRFNNPGVRSIY